MKKEVPIQDLSLEQLQQVGKQLEQEINNLSSSYTSLKVVLNKFQDNKEYIKDLTSTGEKEMLIPMTSSVYVPGKLSDIKSLMIEIGGNYLVDTSLDKAEAFCDRKVKMIKGNMDKIDEMIRTKNSYMNAINQNIIVKNQEIIQKSKKK